MPDKQRAVFLDRDGTINVERNYLWRIADFAFLPGVPQALKRLQDAGFLLVVVTNQAGIARGYYGLPDVKRLHEFMKQELQKHGVSLAGIYICPHHPNGKEGNPYSKVCRCRKGEPGMLLQAAQDLSIDLSRSFMIGDKLSDLEAGQRAGCIPCLITTGHADWKEQPLPDFCASISDTMTTLANFIIHYEEHSTR